MISWRWSRHEKIVAGECGPRLWRRPVPIPLAEVRSHVHVSGVTGMGKTRFLAHLFLELLARGQAATLLDPHGDASRLVLDQLIARGYYDDDQKVQQLIYLDLPAASRQGRSVPYNVLRQPHLDPHTIARSVLEALRRAWPSLDHGQAPVFENVVLAGTFVLLVHDLPLTRLHELLIHDRWREQLLDRVADPAVVGFFRERWNRWGRERPLLVESCLRRLFLLAFSPVLRHSLGQVENLLDLRRLMDEGRSLIVNLALSDPDARRLLGCLLTVGFEQAALSRASSPTAGRSHVLLLDEFSEFAGQSTESVSRMLALCRKFGLSLVLAHQTWTQTTAQLQGALQNVGMMVTFRQGRSDAEQIARMLGRVDPMMIKHEASMQFRGASHPLYSPLAEQWETSWVQALQDLKPREFFLRRASGAIARLRVPQLGISAVTAHPRQAIEARYLQTYSRVSCHDETMGTPQRLADIPIRVRGARIRNRASPVALDKPSRRGSALDAPETARGPQSIA